MRILVVTPHYFPEAFSITNICEELAKRGHSIFVLTGQPCYGRFEIYPGYEKTGKDKRNGVDIYRVKVFPRKKSTLSLLRNYFSFWENSKRYAHCLKTQFDIVFSICLSPITSVSAANLYSRLHHTPHLHYCLDLWPASVVAVGKKSRLLYAVSFQLSKRIYNRMDEIMVSSPSFVRYFRDVLNIQNKKMIFVPQPSLLTPSFTGPSRTYLSKINFVYAGNIGSVQGVENLVLACLPFKDNHPFCLHLIGSGSNLKSVLDLIEKEGLSGVVKYEGVFPPDQIGEWLSSASALLVSLKSDAGMVSSTIPNKLVTYLSFGKPIIASIVGDGMAVCKASGGCLVSSSEVQAISKNYRNFLDFSEAQKRKMGGNNRHYFETHFSFEKIIDQIEEELLSLVSD